MVRRLVLAALMASSVVAAQPKPSSDGARLFEEGRALAKAGKHAEACDRFARSLEIDPAIGTTLNLADCSEKQGKLVEAWRLFDQAAVAEKLTNADRARFARGRADALLPKLGVVVVKLTTQDAPTLSVTVAGRTLKPGPEVRDVVEPGTVTVVVTAAGATPFQREVPAKAGETVTVEVPALEQAVASPEVVTAGATRRRSSRVWLSAGVGGAGAVGLVTSVALGLKAKGDYDAEFDSGHCMDAASGPVCNQAGFDAQRRAVSLASASTLVGVAGVALLAGGAVLFFTAPRDVIVAPAVTEQSAGLSVVGRF